MLRINFETPVVLDVQLARTLSDKDLSCRILNLAKHETEVTILFLMDLMEVDRRSLHIDDGYPSLFSFVCA